MKTTSTAVPQRRQRNTGEAWGEALTMCVSRRVRRRLIACDRSDGERRGGRRRGKRLRPEAQVVQRFHQHPLRAANRANRLQTAVADAVVDGAPRDLQQLRRLVDRDAPSETRLGRSVLLRMLVRIEGVRHLDSSAREEWQE